MEIEKILFIYAISLIKHGNWSNPRRKPIELEELRYYLEKIIALKGDSILDQQLYVDCFNKKGYNLYLNPTTLLMLGIATEDLDVVKVILECGADPNSDVYYFTAPLGFAISLNHEEIIDLLIDFGANKFGSRYEFTDKNTNLDKYKELIDNMTKYKPNGSGYYEAKQNFYSLNI